jgi:hypothetical protein
MAIVICELSSVLRYTYTAHLVAVQIQFVSVEATKHRDVWKETREEGGVHLRTPERLSLLNLSEISWKDGVENYMQLQNEVFSRQMC